MDSVLTEQRSFARLRFAHFLTRPLASWVFLYLR